MSSRYELGNEVKKELIVESWKQARVEIDSRLQTNINLILQKIVTCGAALGFLINQKYDPVSTYLVPFDIQLLGFILVPIVAMLYDVLIARNIRGIVLLAAFIRDQIEELMPKEFTLWETYVKQEFHKDKNTGIENLFLLLFTLGTEVMAAFIFFTQNQVYLLSIPILLVLHYRIFKAVQELRGHL